MSIITQSPKALVILALTACGMEPSSTDGIDSSSPAEQKQKDSVSTDTPKPSNSSDVSGHAIGMQQEREPSAKIQLNSVRSSGTSYDSLAMLDYQNTDFVQAIRCSASFKLKSPTGLDARNSEGLLTTSNSMELKAIWQTALSETSQCRMLSEKIIRVSFSDPFAQSGNYFYLFNPCRSSSKNSSTPVCYFNLVATKNISIVNNTNEARFRLNQILFEKEGQLAALTLNFRDQLLFAIEAQKRCEGNTAVDAVKEARTKALSTVLSSGIAGAIGGLIGGPAAAVALAQQTFQWIAQYYGSGTQANPSRCTLLKDAEASAQSSGEKIETLRNEISQLQQELARI